MKRLVVLISGNGSNLQAILDACESGRLRARVSRVISNREGVFGLTRARKAGVPSTVFTLRAARERGLSREDYDRELAQLVLAEEPDLVVLAGWMHILGPTFLGGFPPPVINLHPALPGQFAGTHAIERALDAYRRGEISHTGVMVHHVVTEVDAGEVITQRRVPISPEDTLAELEARVHAVEHVVLVQAVARVLGLEEPPMEPRALLSVYHKQGLEELARGLVERGWRLIASGGTARALTAAGLQVTAVEEVTGSPEILGGRVKTLHPAIHGGILARGTQGHQAELAAHGIGLIDLVVCNLYPFEQTAAREGASHDQIVEEIDIGGVTLLRAAAKNFERVTVITDPQDYPRLLGWLDSGGPPLEERRRLAWGAFCHTAAYDAAIAGWLGGQVEGEGFPSRLGLTLERTQALRYGENPHQRAALYRHHGASAGFTQLSGKELSYNNLLDLDAAWSMPGEFDAPTVAIVKHTNPSGLASADSLVEAYQAALACDPVSAFGSVIAVNRPVDVALVEAIGGLFVEVLAAPAVEPAAAALLAEKKKNCRVLVMEPPRGPTWQVRSVATGLLFQSPDALFDPSSWRVVTRRAPTSQEWEWLHFAARAVKHVKSNAIVFSQGRATVGVGAGQMNRVDSVRLAARRAGERARGAVMGSDAFFPFPDGIEVAAEVGITAVVQPGGSVRDTEVIAAADERDLAMVFTGVRNFKH